MKVRTTIVSVIVSLFENSEFYEIHDFQGLTVNSYVHSETIFTSFGSYSIEFIGDLIFQNVKVCSAGGHLHFRSEISHCRTFW